MPSNENREVHTESSCTLAAEDCERRIQEALDAGIEHLRSLRTGGWHPHVTAQLLEDALDTFNAPLQAAREGHAFRVVNPQMIGSASKIGRSLDQAIRDLDEFDGNGNVVAALIDAREQHRALVHDCRLSQTIIDMLELSIIHNGRHQAEGEQCTTSTSFLLALRDLVLAHYEDTGTEADSDRQERAWHRLKHLLVIECINTGELPSFVGTPNEPVIADFMARDTATRREWGQGFQPDESIARITQEAIEKGELTPPHEVAAGHVATFDTEPLVKHALDSVIADLTRIKGADMVPRDLIDGRAFILAAGTSQGEA